MSDSAARQEPVLLEETTDGVRLLTLNRTARRNALSSDLVQALIAGFEAAAADDDVRVVGLTGNGDAFCAGADLKERRPAAGGTAAGPTAEDQVVRLVSGIRVDCEKPVIAGINGLAIGAGLALAMCADMRIASARARFHPGYARAGSSPDCGLSWTLPQAIGHERAMRFLLDAQMVDADSALALGLVGEVAPVECFDEVFRGYCCKIAQVAPIAARQTKRLVTRAGLLDGLEDHLREEITLAARALKSADGKEAVRAIFEKRTPVFTGR
jgi:2-(1,2-epoxy-1,2-dihydrophenyl)acetyl-CoA isomerase